MACLAGSVWAISGPPTRHLAAHQQMGGAPIGCYITAYGLSMASLLNAAQAILHLPGIFK